MGRDLPPPASTARRERHLLEHRYRFLTYVFGGGVKVREHVKPLDALTPVRGAAVRGQLRFWWRACNPRGCTTAEELRQQEAQVWGATDQASPVVIEILRQPVPRRRVEVYEYIESNGRARLRPRSGMHEIAYGAFPLQPSREAQKSKERPGELADFGAEHFVLAIEVPPDRQDLEEDIAAALWAWGTFGGLGARVRRGFGAIEPHEPGSVAAVQATLARHTSRPRIPGVPSLAGCRFAVSPTVEPALEAWKRGLRVLRDIRQGVNQGRNPPSAQRANVPAGRSRWPEPDEIRRITGQSAQAHRQPEVSVERFPRAVFGMPIVFHFSTSGDPQADRLELTPAGFDRLASPLIIRPLADEGGYRAAALVLAADVPDCQFFWDAKTFPAPHRLDAADAAAIPALRRRSGGAPFTDPLELFLHELQQEERLPGAPQRR